MKFRNIFITLETALFNDLEITVGNYNLHFAEDDDNKIMMDKAVFLIDQIRYQKSIRIGDVTDRGYIRIPSKFLNVYLQKELNKYKDFLKRFKYIDTIPYNKEQSKSYGYKVCFFENKHNNERVNREYVVYKFLSMTYKEHLLKATEKIAQIEHKKAVADRNTRHLTKWINEEIGFR